MNLFTEDNFICSHVLKYNKSIIHSRCYNIIIISSIRIKKHLSYCTFMDLRWFYSCLCINILWKQFITKIFKVILPIKQRSLVYHHSLSKNYSIQNLALHLYVDQIVLQLQILFINPKCKECNHMMNSHKYCFSLPWP